MQHTSRQFVSIFFAICISYALSFSAFASNLTWDAPSSVSQGRAFIITVKSENPFTGVLTWRKKIFPFKQNLFPFQR